MLVFPLLVAHQRGPCIKCRQFCTLAAVAHVFASFQRKQPLQRVEQLVEILVHAEGLGGAQKQIVALCCELAQAMLVVLLDVLIRAQPLTQL